MLKWYKTPEGLWKERPDRKSVPTAWLRDQLRSLVHHLKTHLKEVDEAEAAYENSTNEAEQQLRLTEIETARKVLLDTCIRISFVNSKPPQLAYKSNGKELLYQIENTAEKRCVEDWFQGFATKNGLNVNNMHEYHQKALGQDRWKTSAATAIQTAASPNSEPPGRS